MHFRFACRKRIGQSSSFATKSGGVHAGTIPPRWLSDLRSRLGKCIIFGLRSDQINEAGAILRIITRDWRALLAGSEGFLVGRSRAGFEGHQIVWGEMVGHQAIGVSKGQSNIKVLYADLVGLNGRLRSKLLNSLFTVRPSNIFNLLNTSFYLSIAKMNGTIKGYDNLPFLQRSS